MLLKLGLPKIIILLARFHKRNFLLWSSKRSFKRGIAAAFLHFHKIWKTVRGQSTILQTYKHNEIWTTSDRQNELKIQTNLKIDWHFSNTCVISYQVKRKIDLKLIEKWNFNFFFDLFLTHVTLLNWWRKNKTKIRKMITHNYFVTTNYFLQIKKKTNKSRKTN